MSGEFRAGRRYVAPTMTPTELALMRHHNSEIYARREAKKLVRACFWLCSSQWDGWRRLRELAADPSWVASNGKDLGISEDHIPLLCQLVKAGIEQRLEARS